ncbi:TPA: IclR family transcriptional regulator [Escherichia coli]|uniref:IclR family transcriptional regulator n=1 Tax=Escherichia TaxID=561 RepID=UPI0013700C54|nr:MULTISPECIES: IclR family transcriptional regulator [Escherichia]HEL5976664.1 IclR family transcriptional regulator [Escherichia coli]EHJ4101985.1 IclR family transcriptional regulator [Escherichia fergusonii]MEB8050604.1 IclR family transcriptional regulator [Escherichia fergusonii]MEB8054935.1 IclR family transcriptional regulator [Escherichia fergusonii]MXE42730.1 IclR family transcriptional regulator [Escherichia sp. HH41S]
MADTSSTTAGAQTLLRGLAVLNAVYNGCHDLKSIGEFTGTTRSTTHRLVTVLVEQRYLRHVPTQGYQLGAKLIEFGARALESTSLYEVAQPVLQRLARYTLDTVHLGIVEGDEVLYLEKINSQRGLEMRSRPGHRMPLAITGIGKALILNRTEEEWRTLFKTCGDETKLGTFIQNMRRYAASGFAFDLEENEPTIRCVAAPVYNARDEIVAAISVASTTTYMSLARLEELAPYVKSCAEEISAELGWGKHVHKNK